MKHNFRVVFDTNIIISAIIFGGNPRSCLELAREGQVHLVTSKSLLFELSQKLRLKFKWQDFEIVEVIEGISKFAEVVDPKETITLIVADPSDNIVLECALEGDADFIISGDKKHLLSLKKFRSIPVISAKEFLDILWKKN